MFYKHSWLDTAATKLLIEVEGKLLFGDFHELQSFVFELKENPPKSITFDLSQVDMIDSSGLGLLIVANEAVGDTGKIILKYPHDHVEQLLRVCNIHEIMEIVK